MVCGIQRQIQKTKSLFIQPHLCRRQQNSRDSELKRLKAKGFGMTINKAEPISLEEEELLWESELLGTQIQ